MKKKSKRIRSHLYNSSLTVSRDTLQVDPDRRGRIRRVRRLQRGEEMTPHELRALMAAEGFDDEDDDEDEEGTDETSEEDDERLAEGAKGNSTKDLAIKLSKVKNRVSFGI